MHIGTEKPQIVTRDGYVVISNDSRIRQSYLLYDPGRGTEDYFLVEARTPRANTYNQSVPDTGVVMTEVPCAIASPMTFGSPSRSPSSAMSPVNMKMSASSCSALTSA